MTLRLTPAQTLLMETFNAPDKLTPETRWRCMPSDLRVAQGCSDKGLLSIDGIPVRGQQFEVCLTDLGISVAKCLLEPHGRHTP